MYELGMDSPLLSNVLSIVIGMPSLYNMFILKLKIIYIQQDLDPSYVITLLTTRVCFKENGQFLN